MAGRILAILLALALTAGCLAAAEPVTIACVGDSITYGYIPNTPGEQSENAYPAVLEALLGEGFEVLNFGVSGASLTENGPCYRDLGAYRMSLDAAADLYIIMLGTNDASLDVAWDAGLFEFDLAAMVNAYRAVRPDARIWLMSPPAAFPNAAGVSRMNGGLMRGELRDIVARVAGERADGYIDLYAATEGRPEWFGGDGLHMLDSGYTSVARIVYTHIWADALSLAG